MKQITGMWMAVIPMLLWPETVPYSGTLDVSYERITLPGNEPLGLLRTAALFDLNRFVYGGVAMYSALTGSRGGFFTVGAEGGVRTSGVSPVGFRSGLYVGAGGGGSAPQGGGLMVRPYAEITYSNKGYSVGAGVSHVHFPNGKIRSNQVYGGISIPMGGSYWRGHDVVSSVSSKTGSYLKSQTYTVSVLLEKYHPLAGAHYVHSATATTPFSLAGVEFVIEDDTPWYTFYQAAGAGGGNANGYMEVFGGAGYRYDVTSLFSFGIQGGIGAAGGGRIDTGGGLMYRTDMHIDAHPFDALSFGIRAGRLGAVRGSFGAWNYGGTLSYSERFYGLGDTSMDSDERFKLSPWRFRLLHKSYRPFNNMFKSFRNGQRNRVDLLGFSLDRFVTKHLYLGGMSYWAYKGKAGGYAEGIFALGYQSDRYHGLRVYAEVQGGVGGGGGLNMGGGFFGSAGGGVLYDIDEALQLHLGAAYIRSKSGTFRTTSVQFGLNYNFSLLSD